MSMELDSLPVVEFPWQTASPPPSCRPAWRRTPGWGPSSQKHHQWQNVSRGWEAWPVAGWCWLLSSLFCLGQSVTQCLELVIWGINSEDTLYLLTTEYLHCPHSSPVILARHLDPSQLGSWQHLGKLGVLLPQILVQVLADARRDFEGAQEGEEDAQEYIETANNQGWHPRWWQHKIVALLLLDYDRMYRLLAAEKYWFIYFLSTTPHRPACLLSRESLPPTLCYNSGPQLPTYSACINIDFTQQQSSMIHNVVIANLWCHMTNVLDLHTGYRSTIS